MSATTCGLDDKAKSTLVARAALVGAVLHITEDDRGRPLFVVSKWALTRSMGTVDEVEAWLRRAGGPDA